MLCSMKIRFIWAAMGIAAGLTAGISFAIMYQNYLATVIAFFSSICASYLFYIHLAYYKSWMFDWSETRTKMIVLVNTVICLLGLAGMCVSLVLAFIHKQGLSAQELKGTNLWIVAVWCWMTFKWTMASVIYTRSYSRKVMRPLLFVNQNSCSGVKTQLIPCSQCTYCLTGIPKVGVSFGTQTDNLAFDSIDY